MMEKKFFDLKVYRNKKNGQGIILLPKKKIKKLPKKVRVWT